MAVAIKRDITNIRKSAERLNAAKPDRIGSPSVGDVVRQGDLYLVCVESVDGTETQNRQLAPGTTQGSRHVVDGECVVYESHGLSVADVPQELIGPGFRCVGECTVTHPEHGHKILPLDTSWVVVYQRRWANEVRRVQD